MNSTERDGELDALVPPPFRPDPRVVRALVVVNAAVPGAIFLFDAARHQLGADGVSYALHTTGALSLICLILSLAITPLRRLTGWSEIVAGRRALGLFGFGYLVAHVAIFVIWDRGGSLSSTLHEIVARRYLTLGTIGLVLFVPLALTSSDRMITRLGPRRWKRLHRLTYVATSLGAIHYVMLVKSDLRQPVAFAGVLGLLLAHRAVVAIRDRRRRARRRPWSGVLRVRETIEETPDVRTFRLAAASGAIPFTHRPGQYLNVALEIGGRRVNRSYTISSSSEERGHVDITVKRISGVASAHLHEALRTGHDLRVVAPAGRFVFEGDEERVVLVGGGVGITPLMAIVRTLNDRRWRGRIDLLYSVKTAADVVFGKELAERAARFSNLHVVITATREAAGSAWTGPRGPIDRAFIERSIPDVRGVTVFTCGPDPMMKAMQRTFGELGAKRVHVEAFLSPPSTEPSVEAEAAETPARADGPVTVQFAASGETTSTLGDETLLDAAEALGIDIPNDCRAGICGQCKTRLVRGRVVMGVEDALTADDRKRRLVLACQARPVADVVVDA